MRNFWETLMTEYAPDGSLFTEEDFRMTRLKNAIFALEETEKRVFLLYCELQSQRKVAKKLGVSTATVNHCISGIRENIKNNYGDTFDIDFHTDSHRSSH